jgi:membrane protein
MHAADWDAGTQRAVPPPEAMGYGPQFARPSDRPLELFAREHPWLAVGTAAAAGLAAAAILFRPNEERAAAAAETERRVFGREGLPPGAASSLLGQVASMLLQAGKPLMSNAIREVTGRGQSFRPKMHQETPPSTRTPDEKLKPARGTAKSGTHRGKPSWWSLLKDTFNDFSQDNATRHAAALAFYAIFSIAPILVIATMVAGMIFGPSAVNQELSERLGEYMGDQGAQTVQTMIASAYQSSGSWIAWAGSIAALIFAATEFFAQLQGSLSTVWNVEPVSQGIMTTIKDRAWSFLLVLGIGAMVLALSVLSSVLQALAGPLASLLPSAWAVWALQIGDLVLSTVVLSALFALVFRILPDVEIAWRDVAIGAVVTAVLFVIGKFLFGLYIGHSAVGSTPGGIGSVLIVLLWAYYSAIVFLLGAEFTQIYAQTYGSRSRPESASVQSKNRLSRSP